MSTNAGVPGIPNAALDTIKDENTRIVLQAIVDGWNVRNGNTGKGDSKFLTESDLSNLATSGSLSIVISRAAQDALRSFDGGLSQNDLIQSAYETYNRIFESQTYKALASRVDLIDKPGGIFTRLGAAETSLTNETSQRITGDHGLSSNISAMGTRIGNSEAAISSETTQRVNADNSIQQTITTQYSSVSNSLSLIQQQQNTTANSVSALTTLMNQVQASVGQNSASIQQEYQARVSADNTLFSQYLLKLDVNGYVSGIGFANTGKVADVIMRTDTFSLVSPSGNRAALIMSNNTINVFDENGTLRVKLGRLS